MNLRYLLSDLDGRINRKPYWICTLALGVVGVVLMIIGYGIGGQALAIIFGLLWLYPFFAVSVKRAHDRNRPTWLIVVYFAVLILVNVPELFGLGQPDAPSTLYYVLAILWLILAVYMLVELGFLRGTVGPNRYGPDPLEGRG